MTDEGAILYPTFPCRKTDPLPAVAPPLSPLLLRWVSRSPLIRPSVRTGAPSQGEGFGECASLPVCKTTSPSPPSRWAGRYGRWSNGPQARQKKEGGPPQGPPNQKRWVQGGRTSSSLVFFPPAFFQKSRAPPESAGPQGAAPQGQLRGYLPVGYAAPPPQEGYPEGYPHFYSTVSWMEPVAFSACTMI